jgi:hypothetical protein
MQNTTKFLSDKKQSERSAREQLKFIFANKRSLFSIPSGAKLLNDAENMSRNEVLTDNQKSYIDTIYEKTMKSLGFESFERIYKPKRNH